MTSSYETRTQQIDRQIEKFESIGGDLLRYYDKDLKELLAGGSELDEIATEVQIGVVLAGSYMARAIIAMKDYKIAHYKQVMDNYIELLKKADPKFKTLEEIYAEKEEEEEEENEDEELDESE